MSPGATEEPGDLDLRLVLRGTWTQLPVLLAGSACVFVATATTLLVGAASPLAGLAAGVVLVTPALMALVRYAGDIVDGEEVGVRDYAAALRALTGRAMALASVPTLLAALTALALLAYGRAGPVFLVPAALGVTSTVLATAALLVLLPLRARHDRPGGAADWLLACHVIGRTPVPFLAAAVVAGLGIWACVTVSNGLFLLVPAPFSLVLAAAYRVSPAERLLSGA